MLNCLWEAAQDKHLDASTCGCLGLRTRLPVSPLLGPFPEGWLHLWIWRRRHFEVIHLQLQRRAACIPLTRALQDWHQQSSPLSLIRMPGISIISCGEWLNKPSMKLSFQQHLFQTSLDGKGATSGEGLTLGREISWGQGVRVLTWCPNGISLKCSKLFASFRGRGLLWFCKS